MAEPLATPDVLEQFWTVLTLHDYNTRLVVLSTAALGLAGGLIGTFLFLRKRALMGDVLSHAMLPGIALAFIVMVAMGGNGKALWGLLAGGAIAGLLGVGCVLLIRGGTRLKDDAALGIVLSVFFGVGIALLGVIQTMPQGSAAGLHSFIYGKTASMIRSDLWMILAAAAIIALACLVLYKELTLLCFDEGFAAAQGWPVVVLDVALMATVTGVTVIGLQAVGLILVIALLIIPPAAARFWTDRLGRIVLLSALFGAAGGWAGASASAMVANLPAGAVIVLAVASLFFASMLFGSARGVVPRLVRQHGLATRIVRQHLLRAIWEQHERHPNAAASRDDLLAVRSWTPARLDRELARASRDGLVAADDGGWTLTAVGRQHAARVVRNHRLWELFLITHAEIAPSHVDRDADQIEHVLAPEMIRELEAIVDDRAGVPASPHAVAGGRAR